MSNIDSRYPMIRASKQVPAHLTLVGEVDVQAKEGESEAPAKFLLLSNTGKPMELDGFFDPVIVDVAGAKFDKNRTPVIMDHDTGKRIGATIEQAIIPAGGEAEIMGRKVKGPMIAAAGEAVSKMKISQGFVEDARAGFPFQVSVGASILRGGAEFVPEGEKVEVNGKVHKGPLLVARKTLIRELSVTVLGADNDTSAKVAAQAKQKELSKMNFEAYVKSLGLDPDTLSDELRATLKKSFEAKQKADANPPADPPPITAKTGGGTNDNDQAARLADEEERVDSIRATAQEFSHVKEVEVDGKKLALSSFKAHAIRSRMSAQAFELELRRSAVPVPAGDPNYNPAIHAAQQVRDMDGQVLSCALLRQFPQSIKASSEHAWTGEKWGYEHWFDEKTLEASNHPELRRLTLHQLMNMQIIAVNGFGFSGSQKSDEFIHATKAALRKIQASSGFTSLDITNIFDDAANKLLLAGYQSLNTTWQEWCRPVTVNDFKTHNFYRLTSTGAYQPVGADGELKHGGFTEDKYQVSAETYGKIYGLTRKHLINDDLGAFESLMSGLGIEGGKTVEELAYVHLLGNLATIFPTGGGNNNYISGADTDLTIDGLSEASQTFEDQVIDDSPILIEPDRILVGTQDRVQAGKLYNDSELRPTGDTDALLFTRNPHVGAFRPIVSGYLNNTAIKQRVTNVGDAIPGQSSDQWFMFSNPGNPQGGVIMVAFLNGNRTPFLERSDSSFDVLGLQWRAYHDVGTGTGEPKFGVHSKGAA